MTTPGQTIPNVPCDPIADKDGRMTQAFQDFLVQLIGYLNANISAQGFQAPQQTAAVISQLQTLFNSATNPGAYYGNLIYDTTNNVLKVNIAGTYHVVQVI